MGALPEIWVGDRFTPDAEFARWILWSQGVRVHALYDITDGVKHWKRVGRHYNAFKADGDS